MTDRYRKNRRLKRKTGSGRLPPRDPVAARVLAVTSTPEGQEIVKRLKDLDLGGKTSVIS